MAQGDTIGELLEGLEGLELLLVLAAVGVGAYLLYKAVSILTNKGGTACGPNKDKTCCTGSIFCPDANCVSGDGVSKCGCIEYATATTCYQGTPTGSAPGGSAPGGATGTCGPNGNRACCSGGIFCPDANCVSGDGVSKCGCWEYATATTCYQGTPGGASGTQPTGMCLDASMSNVDCASSSCDQVMSQLIGESCTGVAASATSTGNCTDTLGNVYQC